MTPVELLQTTNPSIVERLTLPPRGERFTVVPEPFRRTRTLAWLDAMLGNADRVWHHQASALARLGEGHNVVISTGTASGKSLVFQTAVIDELLHSDGCALILYPQKALGGDQMARWERALELAGLSVDLVGEINGDVAMAQRGQVLERARIILATPDVIHAWMMRQVASAAIAAFLRRLRLLVIDEAHVLEGAFGSNCVYLFRRLRCASLRATRAAERTFQIIAATATIADAAGHLETLTGLPFIEICEAESGAPCHERTLLHIDGPAHGDPAEKMLADMLITLAERNAPHAFIAFADSRQGVERIARRVGRDDVLPYRSGYEGQDRRAIEAALRAGGLRGVISTSALELGIDIPQFTTGLNLGIPQSRKAFRQRVGRIGRSCPGVFALIAPMQSFAQLGSSFQEFHDGSVEPSHLYTHNQIIQFAQARCLLEECEQADDKPIIPTAVTWPDGFDEMLVAARPGAVRPRALDAIAMLGGDNPHYNYPIRNICETSFALRQARGDASLVGTIPLGKAIREAYPGAIYYHMRRAHRVVEWRSSSYDRTIRLEPIRTAEQTRPILNTLVSVAMGPDEIIDQRIMSGPSGTLAEIQLRVSESVEGYSSGAARKLYRDLRLSDARMTRRQREISTTGVVVRIDAPWFAGKASHQVANRRAIANALRTLLAREHSVALGEIAAVHAGIALYDACGSRKIDDAIVVYDAVAGGLRLTSPLFGEFGMLVARLLKAAEVTGADALVGEADARRLEVWYHSLTADFPLEMAAPSVGVGEHLIFAPDSRVGIRQGGTLSERVLVGPQLVSLGEADVLMYRYHSQPGVQALVPHDMIEPVGHDWRRAIWTVATNEIREVAP